MNCRGLILIFIFKGAMKTSKFYTQFTTCGKTPNCKFKFILIILPLLRICTAEDTGTADTYLHGNRCKVQTGKILPLLQNLSLANTAPPSTVIINLYVYLYQEPLQCKRDFVQQPTPIPTPLRLIEKILTNNNLLLLQERPTSTDTSTVPN